MQPTLLSVQGASKRFGDVVALQTVNLEIREGDIIGLVDLMAPVKPRCSGCYRAFTGRRPVAWCWMTGPKWNARQRLGVVPENTGLYARLTAWENIRYHARMHGVNDDEAWQRTVYFAKHLDMVQALAATPRVSRGYAAKDSTSAGVGSRTFGALLDEPTAGLDVYQCTDGTEGSTTR